MILMSFPRRETITGAEISRGQDQGLGLIDSTMAISTKGSGRRIKNMDSENIDSGMAKCKQIDRLYKNRKADHFIRS